jgi:SAM-dependent methyltransferase
MINPYLEPHLAEMPMFRVLVRSVECQLLSEVPIERPLLDIGSGDGHFAATLFKEPVDVGIDMDPVTMKEAQARGAYRNLILASANQLPFRDGSFRSVLCNSTFEHIPDVESALGEAGRVLEPGGLLLATSPSEYYNRYMLPVQIGRLLRMKEIKALGDRYLKWFNRRARHFHVDPPDVWMRRFNAAGLEVVHWRYLIPFSSHIVFELSHYFSVPSVLVKRLFGRWVLWPGKARFRPLLRVVNSVARSGPSDHGAGLFFVCKRTVSVPEKREAQPLKSGRDDT